MNDALKNADYKLLEIVAHEHAGHKKFADFFHQNDYDSYRSILKSLKEQKLGFPVIFPTGFPAGWMKHAKKAIQGRIFFNY